MGGHIVFAAELATPDLVSFMVRHTSGFVCVAMLEADADRLLLPPMSDRSGENTYGVTGDARSRFSTGLSAGHRTRTIRLLADPATTADDLERPGHVVPIRVKSGGLLEQPGYPAAATDLAALAGLRPASVLSHIVSERDPRGLADLQELREFCDRHELALISTADLASYRCKSALVVHRVPRARIPLNFGEFTAYGYRGTLDRREHLALVFGDIIRWPERAHLRASRVSTRRRPRLVGVQLRRSASVGAVGGGREGRGVVLYLWGLEHNDSPIIWERSVTAHTTCHTLPRSRSARTISGPAAGSCCTSVFARCARSPIIRPIIPISLPMGCGSANDCRCSARERLTTVVARVPHCRHAQPNIGDA